jgi:hypothetical protein
LVLQKCKFGADVQKFGSMGMNLVQCGEIWFLWVKIWFSKIEIGDGKKVASKNFTLPKNKFLCDIYLYGENEKQAP